MKELFGTEMAEAVESAEQLEQLKVFETVQEQAERCCKNAQAILEANSLDFADVVKVTCFLKDMGDFQAFNEVYAKYFVGKPARSCVAVRELPKDALCEIEFIAAAK